MTLKKNFLLRKPDFIQIPIPRVILGIIIGLFFSFAFYSLLYIIREIIRILSVTETYDLWILTDNEVHFYNLIFAFISVIIGQSVTFSLWLDRPKSIFGKQNYRKTTIINDQRALNWCFLSWFSKLAILFGLMFGLAFHGGFYVFSFYPDYNYVFILVIIVLFLQTWNAIILTFKLKGLKWMVSSAVLLSIIAYGLSHINLIDYKAINNNYFQKNIHYHYKLELPETDSYEVLLRRSSIENIYIVESKNLLDNAEPIIIVDNESIELQKLNEKVKEWKSYRSEIEVHHMVYRLNIHSSIKMDFINQVKNELTKSGIYKIAYAVVPANRKYDIRYYQDLSFPMILPNWNFEWLNPIEIYQDLNQIQNIIEIKQPNSTYLINNSLVKATRIKSTIKELIQQNSDYIVMYYVGDSVEFSDYFRVLSTTKEAVDELRNEFSEKKHSKQYELLDFEEAIEVREEFPFRIFEITSELKKRIEDK